MMEELKRFIVVWFSAVLSVCYCYYLPTRIKPGVLRLLYILPVCAQFFVFPMLFTSSFVIKTIMLFLTGMGSLKLILFAFDKGPLFPLPSLFQFICFTCFPIKKLQKKPKSLTRFPIWGFAIKVAIVGILFHVRQYKQNLPPMLLLGFHALNSYFPLEISLTLVKFLLTITLGFDLEPVFDEPYLATSLQDFWGRRWNPMVSSILRSGVYAPIRGESKRNSGLAKFMGVLTTFLVSGLFHELLYFYTNRRVMPSGGITLFYVLHGVCTATEVVVKRTTFGRRWGVRPVVSWVLTMAFILLTSGWLYLPQVYRGKTRQ